MTSRTTALQAKALRAAGCRRLFEETASGGRWIGQSYTARWTIFARTHDCRVETRPPVALLEDVLHIMEQIGNAGAWFRSVTENIDTTTAAGGSQLPLIEHSPAVSAATAVVSAYLRFGVLG